MLRHKYRSVVKDMEIAVQNATMPKSIVENLNGKNVWEIGVDIVVTGILAPPAPPHYLLVLLDRMFFSEGMFRV